MKNIQEENCQNCGNIFSVSRKSNFAVLRKYIDVIYNPDGFCIDGTLITSELEKKLQQPIQQQSKSPTLCNYRLPAIRTYSEQESEGKEEMDHGSRLSEPLDFYHEKNWHHQLSQAEKGFSWNERSNSFLITYYQQLGEHGSVDDKRLTNVSSCSVDYDTQDDDNESLSKVFSDFSAPLMPSMPKLLPKRTRLKNEHANSWLRSYVDIAHAQKVTFSDIVSAADTVIRNNSKKMN